LRPDLFLASSKVVVVRVPLDAITLSQIAIKYGFHDYLVSLCSVCALQNLQCLRKLSFSGVVRLFLVVV